MSAERMSTTRRVAERTATSNGMARFGDLAERVGTTARVETVFGEPVERDGVTVIPVARARWGFGGGTGARSGEEGEGAGGGTVVSPVGFIELRKGNAHFRRIPSPARPLAILAGAALALMTLGRIMDMIWD